MQALPEPIESLRLPIKRSHYERMVEARVFGDDRVELLYGVIVQRSPHGPPHDATLTRLSNLLTRAVLPHALVRTQCSFAASDGSEPEPDITVVPSGDYDDAHPSEAILIVEVAVSSVAIDRGAKARLYAECGVPEYWVVDVDARTVEVHTEPQGGRYARVTPYRRGDAIELVALTGVIVSVDAFLR